MSLIWAFLAVMGGFLLGLLVAVVGDLVSEEVRVRLDRIPIAMLRLAARRLPPEVRGDRLDEWTAELHEFLHGAEALPITRLVRGIRFAVGMYRAAPNIAGIVAPASRVGWRRRAGGLLTASKTTSTRAWTTVRRLYGWGGRFAFVADLVASVALFAAAMVAAAVPGLAGGLAFVALLVVVTSGPYRSPRSQRRIR